LSRLLDVQKEIQWKLNSSLIGSTQKVLVESKDKGGVHWSGRTSCNRIVNFESLTACPGQFSDVHIAAAGPNSLTGHA